MRGSEELGGISRSLQLRGHWRYEDLSSSPNTTSNQPCDLGHVPFLSECHFFTCKMSNQFLSANIVGRTLNMHVKIQHMAHSRHPMTAMHYSQRWAVKDPRSRVCSQTVWIQFVTAPPLKTCVTNEQVA